MTESDALAKKMIMILKEKEIYDKTVAEWNNEINTLNNKTEYGKLTYYLESEDTIPIDFNDFNRPFGS